MTQTKKKVNKKIKKKKEKKIKEEEEEEKEREKDEKGFQYEDICFVLYISPFLLISSVEIRNLSRRFVKFMKFTG